MANGSIKIKILKSRARSATRERGPVVLVLDREKAAFFIKEKLDAPDVPVWADAMVIVNGENGPATVIEEGVGWYADAIGFVPINYSGPAGLGGYLEITLEELIPLIGEETTDLADFVAKGNERLEDNCYIWQQYAKGFPQDKTSLIASAKYPPGRNSTDDSRE